MATSLARPSLPPACSAAPSRFAAVVAVALASLQRLEAWLAARRRAAQDRADLAAMGERELADIGLPRASIEPASRGAWSRDPWA
ncbi:MAG TPA: DUF1127 domain-containing protein [Casimicrobiaceae bacterium]|nr:DUF1127 domain-containing protein [Casimicrobiaceae bacterium]